MVRGICISNDPTNYPINSDEWPKVFAAIPREGDYVQSLPPLNPTEIDVLPGQTGLSIAPELAEPLSGSTYKQIYITEVIHSCNILFQSDGSYSWQPYIILVLDANG